jgi:hypothetical protein
MRTVQRWLAGVVLAAAVLMLPAMAAAATKFNLGGYVALYTIWDSTQTANNLRYINRNNDPTFQHGRLKFTAERTRMNFTIIGPKLWGAKTSAFIEWDFDNGSQQTSIGGSGWASANKPRLRLRHAMFRLNWPETELLMGQYWSLISEDPTEAARPGTSGIPGIIWFREPQIRLSHKFFGVFNAAVSIANAGSGPDSLSSPADQVAVGNTYVGESAETPRLSGRIRYEQDLWGKAAFYGKPRGFSARVAAGWQRSRYQAFAGNGRMFAGNNFVTVALAQQSQQYLNLWAVDMSLFIPILTTSTANLAHTMSLLTHWYIGEGLDVVKEGTANNCSYLIFNNVVGGVQMGERQEAQQFGGLVQLQYYFNNQWYLNLLAGMQRVYGVDRDRWMGTTTGADPTNYNEHCYATLWYRPIQALKFAVEYGYVRTGYFQRIQRGTVGTDVGENHEVLFVGFFLF